jgi:4-carboxymuconolactone decarboxylase
MALPPIDPDTLTPAQQVVHDAIAGGGRGGVRGPFTVMLHAPALTARMEKVGHYLRYEGTLPDRARELAILIVARHHRCDTECMSHRDIALRAGLPETLLADIAATREPAFEDATDRVVHHFVRATIAGGEMADNVLQPALDAFGTEGTVELNIVVGYYTLLAMLLVSFGVPSAGGPAPWNSAG